MPRIRTIKPQFWLDEDLGSICRDARLLYIGLWNLADDTGVFEYRPARIKVQLFPYDNDVDVAKIKEWLQVLESVGNIGTFNINGKVFGYIYKFSKHQDIKNPSNWIYASPPPEMVSPTVVIKREAKRKIQQRRNQASSFTQRPEVRTFIFGRDKYRCVKCGSTKRLTIDHIIPVYSGGSDDFNNLQTLCNKCNAVKAH